MEQSGLQNKSELQPWVLELNFAYRLKPYVLS